MPIKLISHFKLTQCVGFIVMLLINRVEIAKAQCDSPIYPTSNCESYTLTAQIGLTNLQWYVDTGNGKQAIAAPLGTAAQIVVNTEGVYSYTARDADNCLIDLCCPFRLVNTALIAITAQPRPIIECLTGTDTLFVAATTRLMGSSLQFQWQISMDSLQWTDIPNANRAFYIPLSNQVGKLYYRAAVSVQGYACPALYSNGIGVSIFEKPRLINITTASTHIQEGDSILLRANFSDNTGKCTIQWVKTENGGTTWECIEGATNTTYQTPPMRGSTKFLVGLICKNSGCCQ